MGRHLTKRCVACSSRLARTLGKHEAYNTIGVSRRHPSGAQMLPGDGIVRFIMEGVDCNLWLMLYRISDGLRVRVVL